jgi:hypothetical protein
MMNVLSTIKPSSKLHLGPELGLLTVTTVLIVFVYLALYIIHHATTCYNIHVTIIIIVSYIDILYRLANYSH